jgi:hypothetical protein
MDSKEKSNPRGDLAKPSFYVWVYKFLLQELCQLAKPSNATPLNGAEERRS